MNEHILLVMKYLKDPKSVSQEELKKNAVAAYATYAAAVATYAAYTAADAASAAAADAASAAACYVDKYFFLTGENKKEYENALMEGN